LNNDNLLFFEENTITIETPIEIDGAQELWIGFYCRAFDSIQNKEKYPMGRDDGPRKEGLGNIGWLDNEWYTFYEFLPLHDYNPYIKGVVQTPDGATVNLYFNGDKIESNIEGTHFYHENPTGEEYCYKVEVNCKEGGVSPFSNEICIPGVGIIDNEPTSLFSMYPNPANNKVTIEGENFLRVEFYDLQGRKILEQNAESSASTSLSNQKQKEIDISNSHAGVYFVKIYSESGITVKKVVIEN
jgi:hypothetical protein